MVYPQGSLWRDADKSKCPYCFLYPLLHGFFIHIYQICIFHGMSVSVGLREFKSVILFRASLTIECSGDVIDEHTHTHTHTHTFDCVQPVCAYHRSVHAACELLSVLVSRTAHLQLEPNEIIMIILPSCITFHQGG